MDGMTEQYMDRWMKQQANIWMDGMPTLYAWIGEWMDGTKEQYMDWWMERQNNIWMELQNDG